MSDDELNNHVTFYNPHPGFAGAAIPIPEAIKKVADELNGKTLSLDEAVKRLTNVGIGSIEVVSKYNYIGLWLGEITRGLGPGHFFRVIEYR